MLLEVVNSFLGVVMTEDLSEPFEGALVVLSLRNKRVSSEVPQLTSHCDLSVSLST